MNKFKNSSGTLYLRGLFYETTLADKSSVTYTLKNEDHQGYPSLYRLFMAADDPTEYTFAIQNLDGWDHWESLCKCTWFQPYVAAWRQELETRVQSRAIAQIRLCAEAGGRDALAANKFLVEWDRRKKIGPKGRPSKEALHRETQLQAAESRMLDSDLERIQGKIN